MTDRPKPPQKKQDKTGKPAPKAAKIPPKKKTVAAEAAEPPRREQPAPPSAVRPASRHVAEAAESVRRAQTAKPASPAAKAPPSPAPKPAVKPAAPRPAVKAPEPAALKAEPKQAPAKPTPQPAWTAQEPAAKTPKPAPAATSAPIAEALTAFAATPAPGPAIPSAIPWAVPANPFAGAAETLQQSFRAAGKGSLAVNRKLFDIAQANMQSGFDLAKSLASARTPLEAAQLQFAFITERMKAFASQAAELRALSSECLTEASEPFRKQLGRKQSGGAPLGSKSDRKA